MAKYTIRYNIVCSHEIEIDADSIEEAKMKLCSDYFTHSDILQDFAEGFSPKDLAFADVEVDALYDEDGNWVA